MTCCQPQSLLINLNWPVRRSELPHITLYAHIKLESQNLNGDMISKVMQAARKAQSERRQHVRLNARRTLN